MPKQKNSFPEQIVVRVNATQYQFLQDLAELHDTKPSEVVRALIKEARDNHVADEAIGVLSPYLEGVNHAADQH
jgi:hypothetical protein